MNLNFYSIEDPKLNELVIVQFIEKGESFFKANAQGVSPLDELVGEKVTPENTRIYICGYQGTIDGVMDYVSDRGFVNRDNPHEDGTFEVKYESYG